MTEVQQWKGAAMQSTKQVEKVSVRVSYRADGLRAEAQMEVADFATKIMEVWEGYPSFHKLDRYPRAAEIIATILPSPRKEVGTDFCSPMFNVDASLFGGTLAMVSIDYLNRMSGVDYAHFFFLRGNPSGQKYLPTGDGCRFSSDRNANMAYGPGGIQCEAGSPGWPWVALHPELFSEVATLNRLITPGDGNPLTGLLQSKESTVRTLAHQIRTTVKDTCDQLVARLAQRLG